ncbi:MAG: TlpA family protein disulfide reductase [Myxococcota bacterium]|jgi:peroxiredoxin|nr:TlpA family protein disulfide reductase [Myxococcota bacterium]
MSRFFGASLLVAFAMALPACGPAASSSLAPVEPALSSFGPTVADFTLRDVDGQSHSLSEHLGKSVVVISFWASWCEPCKRELAKLDELYKAYKEQGLVVLAISMDEPETLGEVRPFVKQRGFAFPVLLDAESLVAARLNPRRSAPFNLIISKDRSIVWSHEGYVPGDEIALGEAVIAAIGLKKAE